MKKVSILKHNLMRATMTLALIVACATAWATNGNWSEYKATAFSNTSGTTINITSPAELALLAYKVTTDGVDYTGYTINLTTDLDMSAHYWDKPIGIYDEYQDKAFRGTFDGGNHTISGIYINGSSDYQGLFGFVGTSYMMDDPEDPSQPGTVRNLTLASSNIYGKENVGGIAGHLRNGTISNCHVLPSVNIYTGSNNSQNHGGIVGHTYTTDANTTSATIQNCTCGASITSGSYSGCSNYGGIIGYSNRSSSTITGCFYYGTSISANSNKGAIVGNCASTSGIGNCYYYYPSSINGIGYGGSVGSVKQVYQLTLGTTDLTISSSPTYTFNGTNYYATATVTTTSNTQIIESLTASSGSINNISYSNNRHSASFNLGSNATVTATFQTISGTTSDGLTWSLGGTNYTELTIGGTGAMQNYSYNNGTIWTTKAPWGTNITKVTVGNGITNIGNYAFCGCQSVASVTLGNSVASIGVAAINHCDQMTTITLPASVNTIGYAAFENCQALTTIYINSTGAINLTGSNNNHFNAPNLDYIVFSTPAGAVANTQTTGNWSPYQGKIRAQLGSQLFAVTNEGGTPAYKIASEQDLRNLSTTVNAGNDGTGKTFRQTADITMSNTNFTPIGKGNNGNWFSGTYDGGNHAISNLHVSMTDHYQAALFSFVESGIVKNIYLDSPNISCTYQNGAIYGTVAGIVNSIKGSTVDHCYVINPTLSASPQAWKVGAIVYSNNGLSSVSNCYFYDINTSHNYQPINFTNNSTVSNVGRAYTLTLGEDVTTTSATVAFSYNVTNYYTGTITLAELTTPPAGWVYTYTVNGEAIEGNTFTISADATVARTATPIPTDFEQTATNEYTIHTATGWSVFCDLLENNPKGYFTGKTVKLGASIGTTENPITRMAGGSYHDFTGTFNGQGNTLTFTYSATEAYAAPFRYVEGPSETVHAAIQNLNVISTVSGTNCRHLSGLIGLSGSYVDVSNCNVEVNITSYKGTNDNDMYPSGLVGKCTGPGMTISGCTVTGEIATNAKYAVGLIGLVKSTSSNPVSATITNCVSSVTINSQTDGDGTHGGFVGVAYDGSTTIEGCLFNGKLLSVGETATDNCGGFVGWSQSSTIAISNSLYAPANIANNETEVGGTENDDCHTFSRNWTGTPTNSYFTRALGTEQGKQRHSITAGSNVTIEAIALTGNTTNYNVSGITAYSNGGLSLGSTLYYGNEDPVSLTLSNTPPAGYGFNGYTTTGGTLEGSGNDYTLTMPDEDVTVSAMINGPVTYLDENGNTQTVTATVLTGSETELTGGWYVVNSDINYTGIIRCYGDVTLILADGCSMNVGTSTNRIDDDAFSGYSYNLDIYGQSLGTGALSVYSTGEYHDAVRFKAITINGGNVTADTEGEGGKGYVAVSGGITINGGIVNANANGGYDGIYANGNVTINGGTVNADGTSYGINANYGSGTITLGWTRATDHIYAKNYNGTVSVAPGLAFLTDDATPIVVSGTISDLSLINGKTLQPYIEWTGSGSEDDPYMIYNKEQLNLLAYRVNGTHGESFDGNGYYSKYFKLGADIIYPHTTAWNDATSTEDNYEAIGNYASHDESRQVFRGHFDGDGHTISGIRIYKGITGPGTTFQGLFGYTANADIHDVILADTRITAYNYTGGIIGWNTSSNVTRCHVAADVTIHAVLGAQNHGGITGLNRGTISHCTSSATLTVATGVTGTNNFGAITGTNSSDPVGTLTDNLAIEATVPAVSNQNHHGAITGWNGGTLERNYYVACTVAGVENATSVGCKNADVTANDGAVPGNARVVAGYGESEKVGWTFIASPLTENTDPATTAVQNIFSASEYDLYRLSPSDTMWQNYKQTGDHYHFNLENGRGYLYATQQQETVKFVGENNAFNLSDTKEVTLPQGFNLVGNPFPRAAYIDKPYYTLNAEGSAVVTETSTGYISPCTGVVVQVENGSETLTFRTTPFPEQGTNNNGNLNIALTQTVTTRGGSSTTTLDNAIVSFNEGSQLGKFYFGTQNANLYLPQGAEEYAIAYSDGYGEMPVNFRANENGQYTITVNPEGVEMAYLHLIDNLTGADVDLLATNGGDARPVSTYTFNAKTTDYENRFKLVFATNDEDGPSTGSGTFAFFSNGNIIVNGEGLLQVIDVMGRVIVSGDAINRVSTGGMTAGVYVLRLINGENVKTQKIVVR